MGEQFRQRSEQRGLLALIESDVLAATALSADPDPQLSLCSLAGREPVLQLTTTAGVITYSRGASPSSIWRGEVVMRCGPAYGVDGLLSAGAAQNRVVSISCRLGRLMDSVPASRVPWGRLLCA